MAWRDSTLHAAGGCHVPLGNLRVEALRHGIDVPMVADGQQNCIAQELVALDVRRYADLVQDLRHGEFVAVLGHDLRAYRVAGRFQDAAYQYIFIKGA